MKSRDILKGKKKINDWSEVLKRLGITDEESLHEFERTMGQWEKWSKPFEDPYWATPEKNLSTDKGTWIITTTGNTEFSSTYSNGTSGEVRTGYSATIY